MLAISLLLLGVSHLMGTPIEPLSLVAFAFVLTPPAFMFTLALVFLLTLLVRHRLIAAVLSLGVVIGGFIVTFWLVPLYATPLVDVTGGYSLPFPSDIIAQDHRRLWPGAAHGLRRGRPRPALLRRGGPPAQRRGFPRDPRRRRAATLVLGRCCSSATS